MHFGTVFNDPIVARDPAVQIAMLDVSTYFHEARMSRISISRHQYRANRIDC